MENKQGGHVGIHLKYLACASINSGKECAIWETVKVIFKPDRRCFIKKKINLLDAAKVLGVLKCRLIIIMTVHPFLNSGLPIQKAIRKRTWLCMIAAALVAVMLVSLYHQFGYPPQKQNGKAPLETVASNGPMIFATLSFSNATGFVTTVHPTSGTIEFVLLPNGTGELSVSYTGIGFNNLTMWFSVTNSVSALNVLSNGTLGTGSGLSVAESSVTWVSYYQVVVNYTVTSDGSTGLYVLELPSTCLSTIVDVGTQPYTGPLTWLDGTIN